MSLGAWFGTHIASTIFWLWIVKWGGAERIEGTLTSGFLVNFRAPTWDADGIKLFGWLMLGGGTIWFIIGLLIPACRFHW